MEKIICNHEGCECEKFLVLWSGVNGSCHIEIVCTRCKHSQELIDTYDDQGGGD